MSSAQDGDNQSTIRSDGATATASAQATDQQNQSSQQVSKSEGTDNPAAGQPLAPPPKPSQQQNSQATPDYFSGQHNNAHFSLEPNPFEQSFGNPSTETPGKNFGGLPSVASLTSPAPLGPGGTPNWQNSLRSGPLSPAMLQGPASNANGYFDDSYRNNYPTPNESSLRTGLTPGGGGSMFPAPSPNTQAIFNLQGGGATPGTLEFQRTAMNAAARSKPGVNSDTKNTSMPQQPEPKYQPAQQAQPAGRQDSYAAHPDSEAVNSLYMLAHTGTRQASNANTNNQFAVPGQSSQTAAQMQRMQNQQQDMHTRNKQSVSSMNSTGDGNEYDEDDSPEQKPSTRSAKGKKGSGSKGTQNANGRRKADDTPSKQPAAKKRRGNNSMPEMDLEDDSDDMGSIKDEDGDQIHANGRKMTDEEKRKNFLERNRVAALKCRQRKKQWLANLQTKVEIFTSENDALTAQCTQLREEVINLKTLLLAHKDCPVSHQQGLGGQAMAQFMGEFNPHGNPYGLQMMNQQGGGQGMQRS